MKCKECCYFWSDCDKNGKPIGHPYCHYQYDDGYAPCEVDDDYETEDVGD